MYVRECECARLESDKGDGVGGRAGGWMDGSGNESWRRVCIMQPRERLRERVRNRERL